MGQGYGEMVTIPQIKLYNVKNASQGESDDRATR